MRTLLGVLGLSWLLLVGAACTTSGPAPTPTPVPATATPTVRAEPTPTATPEPAEGPERVVVDIEGFAFLPQEITIPAGSSVTWVMRDRGTTHTVTIEGPGPDLDERLETGESFQFTFDEAGVYRYFCRVHPDTPSMHAIVRVGAGG